MAAVRIALLMVHITAAAFLLGGSAGLARPLRRNLKLGHEAFHVAAEDAVRRLKMLTVSSLTTLLTGVALIFVSYQGFGPAPKNFHAALGLMLVALAVNWGLLRPALGTTLKLAKAETLDADKARAAMKKVSMGQGVVHLLWLILLLLMFVRF